MPRLQAVDLALPGRQDRRWPFGPPFDDRGLLPPTAAATPGSKASKKRTNKKIQCTHNPHMTTCYPRHTQVIHNIDKPYGRHPPLTSTTQLKARGIRSDERNNIGQCKMASHRQRRHASGANAAAQHAGSASYASAAALPGGVSSYVKTELWLGGHLNSAGAASRCHQGSDTMVRVTAALLAASSSTPTQAPRGMSRSGPGCLSDDFARALRDVGIGS